MGNRYLIPEVPLKDIKFLENPVIVCQSRYVSSQWTSSGTKLFYTGGAVGNEMTLDQVGLLLQRLSDMWCSWFG